jgi:hypothetical protein
MAAVGSFGMLVLLANIIWGYNIYLTGPRVLQMNARSARVLASGPAC